MINLSKYAKDEESQNDLTFASFADELEDHSYLDSRLQQWFTALQSVYALILNGDCPYFYILTETSPILFLAAGVNQVEQVRVIVSHSTQQFRQKLQSERIRFDIVNADSLIFIGKRRIHALYDFLLSYIQIQSFTRDLPLLVAPVAYTNGTLQNVIVQHTTFTKTNNKVLETHHMLELRGIMLPHMWYHLLPVMQQAQEGEFSFQFTETEQYTEQLNNLQSFDINTTSQAASQMTQLGYTQQAGAYWLNQLPNSDEFSYLQKAENKEIRNMAIQSLTCSDNVYTSVKLL
jgi:hypothetical protein